MKQLLFMVAATLFGTAGVYVISPFWGVFVYYLFAVLRPHYMWEWALPRDITWSYYVGVATIGGAVLGLMGVLNVSSPNAGRDSGAHRISAAHCCLFAFALWIGVTFLTARNTAAAAWCFEEYVKIFVMYAVGAYLVRTVSQIWALFLMAGVALGYIAYEINYQYVFNHYLRVANNGYGGLDNNGAGLMLAMGVPICWFAFEGIGRWWRWVVVSLIPILIHAVLMTYSRGAMVSLVVMCPALMLRSRHRVQVCLAMLGFGFVLIPAMAGSEIKARFLTIQDHEVDDSANSRRQSWAAAWRMANDNPIFGVGVRNSNLFSYEYGADMYGRTIHSQYLQIAADNGLVGLALYLAILTTAWLGLRRCRRSVADRTDDEACRITAIANGVECSLAVYCFGAIFLSLEVFELPYLLLLLATQLETVTGASAQAPERVLHASTDGEGEHEYADLAASAP
jgi:probable O-glycosylation ligase (exosortase A-associated)